MQTATVTYYRRRRLHLTAGDNVWHLEWCAWTSSFDERRLSHFSSASSVFEVSIWTPFPRSRLRAVALVGELEVSIVDAVLVDRLLVTLFDGVVVAALGFVPDLSFGDVGGGVSSGVVHGDTDQPICRIVSL